MNKLHAVTVALAITTTLFITACGLQGDLYFPEEKTASEESTAAPVEAQGTNSENTDNETTEDEKSNPSSEQAP